MTFTSLTSVHIFLKRPFIQEKIKTNVENFLIDEFFDVFCQKMSSALYLFLLFTL